MSLVNALKNKPVAKIEPISKDNRFTYCEQGKEKEFLETFKNRFPECMPLIKAAKDAGLIDGLRNISYRLNDEY